MGNLGACMTNDDTSSVWSICFLSILAIAASLLATAPARADLAGSWATDYGTMYLDVNAHGHVDGAYDEGFGGEKVILGQLVGNRLIGFWIDPSGSGACSTEPPGNHQEYRDARDWGRVNFIFNQSFTRFTGRWSRCDVPVASDWTGSKLCNEQSHPGGTWATDYGNMYFPDRSTGHIRGTYEFYGGRIIGTLTGQTLSGKWVEDWEGEDCKPPVDGSGRYGPIVMEFGSGFYNFNATYAHCDADLSGVSPNWSGTRECAEQPGEFPEWQESVLAVGESVAPDPPFAERPVFFRLTLMNTGEALMDELRVELQLTAPLDTSQVPGFVAVYQSCSVTGAGRFRCDLSNLAPRAPVTLTFENLNPVPGTWTWAMTWTEAGPAESAPTTRRGRFDVLPLQTDLTVGHGGWSGPAHIGSVLRTSFTVTNTGPAVADSPLLHVRFEGGPSFNLNPTVVDAETGEPCFSDSDGTSFTCRLGTVGEFGVRQLASEETQRFEVEIQPRQSGELRVVAEIETSTTDVDPQNNQAIQPIDIEPPDLAVLRVDTSDIEGTVYRDESLSLQLALKNMSQHSPAYEVDVVFFAIAGIRDVQAEGGECSQSLDDDEWTCRIDVLAPEDILDISVELRTGDVGPHELVVAASSEINESETSNNQVELSWTTVTHHDVWVSDEVEPDDLPGPPDDSSISFTFMLGVDGERGTGDDVVATVTSTAPIQRIETGGAECTRSTAFAYECRVAPMDQFEGKWLGVHVTPEAPSDCRVTVTIPAYRDEIDIDNNEGTGICRGTNLGVMVRSDSPSPARAGQTTDLTIEVFNSGNVHADDVAVEIQLDWEPNEGADAPEGTPPPFDNWVLRAKSVFVLSPIWQDCPVELGQGQHLSIDCYLGVLTANGGGGEISLKLTSALPGVIKVRAQAMASEGVYADPVDASNTIEIEVLESATSDLSVESLGISVPNNYEVITSDELVTFKFSVKNLGPDRDEVELYYYVDAWTDREGETILLDVQPIGETIDEGSCDDYKCQLGVLDAGDAIEIGLLARVPQVTRENVSTRLSVSARAMSATGGVDTNHINDRYRDTFLVAPALSVDLDIKVENQTVRHGQAIVGRAAFELPVELRDFYSDVPFDLTIEFIDSQYVVSTLGDPQFDGGTAQCDMAGMTITCTGNMTLGGATFFRVAPVLQPTAFENGVDEVPISLQAKLTWPVSPLSSRSATDTVNVTVTSED